MSIVELSRAAGTKYPNISAMENDRRAIGLVMAKKLAKILKTDYTKFID
jgi:plasmid maintenance system antidote protein VapI